MHGSLQERKDLLARIVVSAGIFLMLLILGCFLGGLNQEVISTWITNDLLWEKLIYNIVLWSRTMKT